jgi:hypothetical protein
MVRALTQPHSANQGEALMRAFLLDSFDPEGLWKVFVFEFDARCHKRPGCLFERISFGQQTFFGYIVVRLRGERGVVIEVSKLAVVKGDFAMEITQEISIVLKLRLFHGTILPMMKKGGLMTALFGGLLIS